MNSITYFRLNSPYPGDTTKNCALTGSEVDNNFYTLEGRDIKSVELSDGRIVITLLNGETLSTDKMNEGYVKDLSFEFDEVNGILTITQNGCVQTITGFSTNYSVEGAISVDGSLVGNGLSEKPIGISPMFKTGQYKPVDKIISLVDGEKLPKCGDLKTGDRYLTIETLNEYGYLYNYEGLRKILCKLKASNSPWRIPSKEDWDDMLNAIEPKPRCKNHNDSRSNKYLGCFGGTFLKSNNYWKKDTCCEETDDENQDTPINYDDDCNCGHNNQNDCAPTYHGEMGNCHNNSGNNYGCNCDCHSCASCSYDIYGFNALPAGYANEAEDYLYFKERAYFWTSTNQDYRDAYIKVLTYDSNKVLQDILASDNYLSVRLVKTYNGDNYNENEDILGETYSTVLMPSVKHGHAIWTSMNIAFKECGCDCSCNQVLPNAGQGIEFNKHYFTNEWNGFAWIRKELHDGESVVVKKNTYNEQAGEVNKDYTEYRVVNGELVDVAGMIYERVISKVSEDINNINIELDNLNDKLDAEIERSTAKDAEHDAAIEATNEALQAEIERSTAKDAEHDAAIEELQQANQDIQDSLQRLEDKDTEIEEEIDQLRQDMEDIEGKLLSEETAFDPQTGILTLKSNDGTNDIDVQFAFNFGVF